MKLRVPVLSSLIISIVSLFAFADFALAVSESRVKAIYSLCVQCHGPNGAGNKSIEAPAIAGLPQWYIERQLKNFRSGLRGTHANDVAGMRMRPMAKHLRDDADLAAVATYVSKLPKNDLTTTVQGNIVKGEQSYAVCSACHGADAKGMQALNAPPLVGMSDWYLLKQLRNFKGGVRAGDPAKDPIGYAMYPIASGLDDESMNNVIAYIQALK